MTKVNKIFLLRRDSLSKKMLPDSIAIIRANKVSFRNSDVENEWRQDSNFSYLTGIEEADTTIVISNIKSNKSKLIVFCQVKDPVKEAWDGSILGIDNMKEILGADDSFELSELDKVMPTLITDCENLYFDFGDDSSFDNQLFFWIKVLKKKSRKGNLAPQILHYLSPILGEMRLIKDQDEIALMREAGKISVKAHKKAMKEAMHMKNEAQVASVLHYEMQINGSERVAYGSIVASSENACTLHYRKNNKNYSKGDLMLIDAGAEYHGYASDITTCFPLGGKFNKCQALIYDSVYRVYRQVIESCKPGLTMNDIHQLSCQLICKELIILGLLQGSVEELIQQKTYERFYMHRIGHWIGRDVHDVGTYRDKNKWKEFQEGMVLTVEPGIYILPADDIDEKWWNIGVRIEDTILITKNGHENLTQGLPRTIDEIESFLQH